MARKPKAIFIGPQRMSTALEDIWGEYDWHTPIPTINDMIEGIRSGKIPQEIELVFVLDRDFDPTGYNTTFEKFIAQISPYCFLGILNYTPDNNILMRERITKAAQIAKTENECHFYFISKDSPVQSLTNALATFKDESKAYDVVSIIMGEEPPKTDEERIDNSMQFVDPPPLKTKGQVITVTSTKGGSGKTTQAVNLATTLAHASQAAVDEGLADSPLKVCVIDFDVTHAHLAIYVGTYKPVVSAMLMNGINDDSFAQSSFYDERTKCHFVLSPASPFYAKNLPPEFYGKLIDFLRARFDYVIIDTGTDYARDALIYDVAYQKANKILFVTDVVLTNLLEMGLWINICTNSREKRGYEVPKEKIGIIVSKSMKNINLTSDDIKNAAQGLPIIGAFPSVPNFVNNCTNKQQPHLLLTHDVWKEASMMVARNVVNNTYPLSDKFEVEY